MIPVLVLVLCAAAAGCGDDGGGETAEATTTAPSSTTTAPIDHRSAMVSRLTDEWGDAALAEAVVDSLGPEGLAQWEQRVPIDEVATTPLLTYATDPAPAEEIDALAVFAFGYRGDVDAEYEPGPVNEAMAAVVIDFLAEHPVPVYAQTEVATLLQDAGVADVTSIDRVVGPDGTLTYLSTMGAAEAIVADAEAAGTPLGTVGVVCFADHHGRCLLTAGAAGMDATTVEGIELPTTYDPESAQPWTRDRVSYLATDLTGRLLLP